MIELRQNKIWSDSLNSTLEFDQSWNCVDKGLHKFICFGEGGDSGGAGSGGGGVEAYGSKAAEVAAELGSFGFGLGLDEEDVFGPPPSVDDPFGVAAFDAFAPPDTPPPAPPAMSELDIAPAVLSSVVAPVAASIIAPQDDPIFVPVPPPTPVTTAPLQSLALPPDPVDVFDAFTPPPAPPDMSELDVVPAPFVNPNIVSTPTDEMVGFGPVSRADIASVPALTSEVYPGFSLFGYNTGVGRGMFGGYTSTDAPTAQADEAQGYGTSEVGSFSFPGFLGGLGKVAANVALPGSAFAINAIQQATLPPGMSDINALSNVLGSDRGLTTTEVMAEPYGRDDVPFVDVYTGRGAPTPAAVPAPPPAPDPFSVGFSDFGVRNPLVQLIEKQREEESTVKMSQGGGLLEMLDSTIGKHPVGSLMLKHPMLDVYAKHPMLNSLMEGSSAAPVPTDTTSPPPPVRAMEAPVEAPPPPTAEELEEMQNIAVMQQVLSGAPVEAQAGGLISAYQMGGPPSPYFEGMVKGRGDGMSDSIPFTIEGTQPAILSRDEYVLPADIVSMMGNGSSDAGAEKIDAFINDFRVQKYGRGKQPPETRRGLSGIA